MLSEVAIEWESRALTGLFALVTSDCMEGFNLDICTLQVLEASLCCIGFLTWNHAGMFCEFNMKSLKAEKLKAKS